MSTSLRDVFFTRLQKKYVCARQEWGSWHASSNKSDILAISQMIKFCNNMRTSSDPLVSLNRIKRNIERILNYQDFPLFDCKFFDPGFETCFGAGNNIMCIVILYYRNLKLLVTVSDDRAYNCQ